MPEVFTPDEFDRMRRTLHRRFQITATSNIVDVAFGLPTRGDAVVRGADLHAVFLVREKKKSPSLKDVPVPRRIELRLKRGDQFQNVSLDTDVVELPRFTQTGRLATYIPERSDDLTTGVVVAWSKPGTPGDSVGIVTVRHAFEEGSGRVVSIRVHPLESGPVFFGTLLWKSPARSSVDAAVVEVFRSDLENAQILIPGQSLDARPPRSLFQVVNDAGTNGRSKRTDFQPTFVMRLYVTRAEGRLEAAYGPLRSLVLVDSTVDRAFRPTTSGSAWVFDVPSTDGRDVAMQVGADEETFRLGVGQVLEIVLDFAQRALVDRGLCQAGTFRMITTY